LAAARGRYVEFVQAGIGQPSPWDTAGRVAARGEAFAQGPKPYLRKRRKITEIRTTQRLGDRPSLHRLFEGLELRNKNRRNALIRQAYLRHGYRLAEITEALDLHYTSVSKVINELEED